MTPGPETTTTATPGSACLCCRRRKLKCTRESSGCQNCYKADLPCVYPQPQIVHRKRGPYKKKDKPAREAHLEHVVKYLSDAVSQPERDSSPSRFHKETSTLTALAKNEPARASEDLVKDALIALTRAAVSDHNLTESQEGYATPQAEFRHPSARQVLDMWQLYQKRVDLLAKIVHCPTFASRLFSVLDGKASESTVLLAISIYHAAVTSCSADESLTLFGEVRTSLLSSYRKILDQELVRGHGIPDLEYIQALVLYLLCITREDGITSDPKTIFAVTVRNAQVLGLHFDPSAAYTPYEAEMRRRLWWTICSLESRCSEEGYTRTSSLWQSLSVRLPANLKDNDLSPTATETPEPRQGITSMSFVLVRFEIMRSNVREWTISKEKAGVQDPDIKKALQLEFDTLAKHIESKYLKYCNPSRPFDWMLITIADIMMIKCSLVLQHGGKRLDDKSLTPSQRHEVLRLSVMIIRTGYRILTNPKCPEHLWFYRSYLQWHSLAIIIAEISHSTNTAFVQKAWHILRPFIEIWDRVYRTRAHDETWNYVNMLIEKARQSAGPQHLAGPVSGKNASCSGGMFPFSVDQEVDRLYDRIHYHTPESLDNEDYQLNGMDIPVDIDFAALNAVFGSTNWEDAMNMQMA